MTITGSLLRSRREQLGLSQAKLAELAGIPQHALSAFELGKLVLPTGYMDLVRRALTDKGRITELVSRKKRYRAHAYDSVPHDPGRVVRCKRTEGNIEYCHVLERLEQQRRFAPSPKGVSALSLFSGCGGFSLGFAWAGFTIRGFLELDPALRNIYRANFPDSLELGGDITKVTSDSLRELASRAGVIDTLIGGPPCQGFSLSGKRDIQDPRNTLFRHYLRFVDALRPRVAVIENVRLLTSMKSPSGSFVKDDIKTEFDARGYRVSHFEVNARDFGVPQHRERVLFVAVRRDLIVHPSIPEPSHGLSDSLFRGRQPWRTFADACSDLPYLESGEKSKDPLHEAVSHPKHVIQWLWDVPEGCSAHRNSNPGNRPPSGYNTTYKRQVWFEPASTIQTTFGMISGCRNVHPIATRSLTVREAARIQSFPDTFQFPGNLGNVRTGIGNAVPPLLAFSLAEHILNNILKLVEVPGLKVEL